MPRATRRPAPSGPSPLIPATGTQTECLAAARAASAAELAEAIQILNERDDALSVYASIAYADVMGEKFFERLKVGPFSALEIQQWSTWMGENRPLSPAEFSVAGAVASHAHKWNPGATVTTTMPPAGGDAA